MLSACSREWQTLLRSEMRVRQWRDYDARLTATMQANHKLVQNGLEVLWSLKMRNRRMARFLLLKAFDRGLTKRELSSGEVRVVASNRDSVLMARGFRGFAGIFISGRAILFPTEVLRTFVDEMERFLDSSGRARGREATPLLNPDIIRVVKQNMMRAM